jgi:hypothetical protein
LELGAQPLHRLTGHLPAGWPNLGV